MVHYQTQPPLHHLRAIGLELPAAGTLCEQQGPELMLSAQWCSSTSIGCGLPNLGNSCYLNSVLQCLAHLPPLANLCLAQQRICSCDSGKCVCCVLQRQVCRMLEQRHEAAPYVIHNNLHVLNKSFVRGRQEDAHELLRCLVDAMERAQLRATGHYNNPHKPPRQPRTLVNRLFGGILQSQVQCLACGHVSATWDPVMDLSLELGGCSSVQQALQRFTAEERLDGDNKYRCEGCKRLVLAKKQLTVYDDPNVLVIHLKRFDGIFGSKISRDIDFDVQLDLEPFITPGRRVRAGSNSHAHGGGSSSSNGSGSALNGHVSNGSSSYSEGSQHSFSSNNAAGGGSSPARNGNQQKQCQVQQQDVRSSRGEYLLHGVLIHQGFSANSGHYFAYVLDGQKRSSQQPQPPHYGHWHCMNDSQVYRVNESTVLKQSAYMLFYVRKTMKHQAQLPEHTEHDAAPPRAAAAAAGLKRSMSNGAGPAAGAQAAMIGPQLPPHLAKRQRLFQEQEGQQQQSTPAAAGEDDVADMFAAGDGAAVFGPQLPPGWPKRSGSDGSAAGSSNSDAKAGAGSQVAAAAGAMHRSTQAGQAAQQGTQGSCAAADTAHASGSAPYFSWAQQRQQPQVQQQQPAKQQQQQQQPVQQAVQSQPQPDVVQQAEVQQGQQQQMQQGQRQPVAKQQQQQPAGQEQPAPRPECRFEPGMYQDVEQHVSSCQALRPWLFKQLSAARASGQSLEQCRERVKQSFYNHPQLREIVLQLVQRYCSLVLGKGAAEADAAASDS